jgi:hypothetical protein
MMSFEARIHRAKKPRKATHSARPGARAMAVATIAIWVMQMMSWTVSAQVTSTAPLTVARAAHTATRLNDGRVLIVGGQNAGGPLDSAEIYDPATGTVSAAGSLSTPRTNHAATLLPNGLVLVTGGLSAGAALDSSEIFDPEISTFLAGPTMQSPRSGHSATVLQDGRILLTGGVTLGTAEIFDPATFQFTPTAGDLATPRWYHGSALLQDGTVLIAGGADASSTVLS